MRTEVFLDSAFAAVVPCLRTGAVREVEAWLLADAARLGRFLGVPAARIPLSPDTLRNPKQEMVNLARRSRSRSIREDLVPRPEGGRQVGPAYTSRLIEFVQGAANGWRPAVVPCLRKGEVAAGASNSLARCLRSLAAMEM